MFSGMSGLPVVLVSDVPDRAESLARGLREAGHQVEKCRVSVCSTISLFV